MRLVLKSTQNHYDRLLLHGALSMWQFTFQESRGGADIPTLVRLLLEQVGRGGRSEHIIAAIDYAKMWAFF